MTPAPSPSPLRRAALAASLAALCAGCRSVPPPTVPPEVAATNVVARLGADMVGFPGKPFRLCRYETTQELWEEVTGENPSRFKGPDRPVENVSMADCRRFLSLLNARPEVVEAGLRYRLPTVEEWKYACRQTVRLDHRTGRYDPPFEELGWASENAGGETHPVGTKRPNDFGLFDMRGNVREWTSTPDPSVRKDRVEETTPRIAVDWSWRMEFLHASGWRTELFRDYTRQDDLGLRLACDRDPGFIPLSVGIWEGRQLGTPEGTVHGLALALPRSRHFDVVGVQLGGINIADRRLAGLQLGAVNLAGSVDGVQIGAVNTCDRIVRGVQLGAINDTDDLRGLQIGFCNATKRLSGGVQIGLVNFVSGDYFHAGAQLGILNVSTLSLDRGCCFVMPLVNARF
jgi:hypothetical protein